MQEAIENLDSYQRESDSGHVLANKGKQILKGNYSREDVELFFIRYWVEIERTIYEYYRYREQEKIDLDEFKAGNHLSSLIEHELVNEAPWIFYAKDLRNSVSHYEIEKRDYTKIGEISPRGYENEQDLRRWNNGRVIYRPSGMPDDTQNIVKNLSDILLKLDSLQKNCKQTVEVN